MIISSLHIYPLKGARAIDLNHAFVTARGLQYDRVLLAVDAVTGDFITQRENQALATIQPAAPGAEGIVLQHPTHGDITLGWDLFSPVADIDVRVWRDSFKACSAPRDADEWLSDVLGTSARLVYQREHDIRPTNPDYAPGGQTSFADGFPFLVTSQSSLDDLNDRIIAAGGQPVPMNRFRPNIVMSGAPAWAEDQMAGIGVDGLEFSFVKPCARCVVTTIDQQQAIKTGPEPLRSLAKFRHSKDWQGVIFGENAVASDTGEIRVGSAVTQTGTKNNLTFR